VTDESLMRAVRDGDLAKLGPLFERYHVRLFDFLTRVTGDRTVAEDLVQEVFMRILKYRSTFRDTGSFEPWLFSIARNARADYFRSRRPNEPLGEDDEERPAAGPGPATLLEVDRECARLRRALMLLRVDKRELLVLARYQDMKYEQIAEVLGIDVNLVKVRIHRAIRELRDIFFQLQDRNEQWNAKSSRRTFQII
jgi:RNA polymerase sigma-70 factor (ECF subfamily)